MFLLFVLAVIMGWIESPRRDRGLSDGAEAGWARTKEAIPPKAEASDYPLQQGSSASSLSPLLEIPYFLAAFPKRTPPEPVDDPDDTPIVVSDWLRAKCVSRR